MYGIINKALEDLVTDHYGRDKWEAVKLRSGVNIDFFMGTEAYDDDITYRLAAAVSEEMDMPLNDVLVKFGEWWVIKTTREKYSHMMEAGGSNLKDFLLNLPAFHNRVMMIYPKLTPPEFKISDIDTHSLHLHYISKRPGLQEFVRGLLQGLGLLYANPVTIELLQNRETGGTHEIFKVSWT